MEEKTAKTKIHHMCASAQLIVLISRYIESRKSQTINRSEKPTKTERKSDRAMNWSLHSMATMGWWTKESSQFWLTKNKTRNVRHWISKPSQTEPNHKAPKLIRCVISFAPFYILATMKYALHLGLALFRYLIYNDWLPAKLGTVVIATTTTPTKESIGWIVKLSTLKNRKN